MRHPLRLRVRVAIALGVTSTFIWWAMVAAAMDAVR